MVFSTVIIVGLAIQIPGGRRGRPRLGRGRGRRVAVDVAVARSLAQQGNYEKKGFVADWHNISDPSQKLKIKTRLTERLQSSASRRRTRTVDNEEHYVNVVSRPSIMT